MSKILQLIAAQEGWEAVHLNEDGSYQSTHIACWAIIEEDFGGNKVQEVVGMMSPIVVVRRRSATGLALRKMVTARGETRILVIPFSSFLDTPSTFGVALLTLLVVGAGWMWRKPAEHDFAASAR